MIAAIALSPTLALASSPAAIIEEVSATNAGVSAMDYVEPGQVIPLGHTGRLVIGYLRSCMRETITGGKVTVGAEKSQVSGGKLSRERVECAGGSLQLSDKQAGKSAVVVFRRPPKASTGVPQATQKVYSTGPFIRLHVKSGVLEIEPVGKPWETQRIEFTDGSVDLSRRGKPLQPGGLYRATAAGKEVVFRVDILARAGGPILARLIRF